MKRTRPCAHEFPPSLPPAAGGRTEITDEGTYDMVKDTHTVFNHTVSIHLYIQKGRVGEGISQIWYWRALVNSSGSVTLDDDTGASQAEPDQGSRESKGIKRDTGNSRLRSECLRPERRGGKAGRWKSQRELGSQVKVAWSKRRFGDLEFFRIWGEHVEYVKEDIVGGERERERRKERPEKE